MTELASFSDWVLALLPRLFLYPGGVWMLAALLLMKLTAGGPPSLRPGAIAADLLKDSLPALALAWTALALIPLPSAPPLAAPVDRLVLCALALVSMFASRTTRGGWEAWVNVGIAVAVVAPLARGTALLAKIEAVSISGVLSMLATTLGLAALSSGIGRDYSAGVRWMVWLGLGFAPVWSASEELRLAPGLLWVSMVYAVVISLFTLATRLSRSAFDGKDWAVAVGDQGSGIGGRESAAVTACLFFAVWGAAAVSLLAALLGG